MTQLTETEAYLLKRKHERAGRQDLANKYKSEQHSRKSKRKIYYIDPINVKESMECSIAMLSQVGYQQDLYKKCCICILNKFHQCVDWRTKSGPISNQCLALATVVEVLEHFNAKTFLMELLETYNIKLDSFDKTSDKIRIFCKNYYWKK